MRCRVRPILALAANAVTAPAPSACCVVGRDNTREPEGHMGWRIVKQPDGKLARFSEVVDDFTHMNMTEAQALALCISMCGEEYGRERVKAGCEDHIPWTDVPSKTGHTRWDEALEIVKSVHGTKAAQARAEGKLQ